MFQLNAKLIKNIEVAPNYYKMVLAAPSIARAAKPGQFVNILVSEKFEPLLRRPFSVHRINSSNLEILYKAVGKATELLSQKRLGINLNILGPLGNGFSILDPSFSILVAGGIGVAPLLFLAEQTRIQYPASRIKILIGAKNKKDILCAEAFKNLGCEVKIATEDGSSGFKGLVTELLKKFLATSHRPQAISKNRKLAACSLKPAAIYACGPKPMLKEIAKISKNKKIPAQISLEEHMACGIGACFGCVVKTKQGYKRVCKEGPVFNA
ncbi:MAG: dihydroorotate dehydrogenase electron transfer subunit, partial [Candidatus Omnitrophica bacterium]|nr:dihydroorotate dehydrogenase electron transfer subunit [Candidatus Omnitrophota bacterium]